MQCMDFYLLFSLTSILFAPYNVLNETIECHKFYFANICQSPAMLDMIFFVFFFELLVKALQLKTIANDVDLK